MEVVERTFQPQYLAKTYGLQVYRGGVLADVDDNEMTVRMDAEGDTLNPPSPPVTPVFERAATRTGVGTYTVSVSSIEASSPGTYRLVFTYALDGVAQMAVEEIEVGTVGPAYTALSPDMQSSVEAVWWRFADLFDSPLGGPHLQVYYQAHMNRNRMAQIMREAISDLNTLAQPQTTYDATTFPLAEWGGLLERATYIGTIKHLMRSYVEQPVAEGVSEARLDRRDYLDRWGRILELEMPFFERQYEQYRMSHMFLGGVRVLVAGGVYPNVAAAPVMPISVAARPVFWARYY